MMYDRWDFNSRTPRGVRLWYYGRRQTRIRNFNSRTPRGVRPGCGQQWKLRIHYFNSRTPRGVRHLSALHRGFAHHFNSRTPRGVRHLGFLCAQPNMFNFNSRTPRGVRHRIVDITPIQSNFNSRTPRGVRRRRHCWSRPTCCISTHASHAECDHSRYSLVPWFGTFQLTHPTRSATTK